MARLRCRPALYSEHLGPIEYSLKSICSSDQVAYFCCGAVVRYPFTRAASAAFTALLVSGGSSLTGPRRTKNEEVPLAFE